MKVDDRSAWAGSATGPLAVAFGGAVGAGSRWALTAISPAGWDSVVVGVINVVGSLFLGLLIARRQQLSDNAFLAGGTGFAGGLTTFSTFAVEVARDLDQGRLLEAAVNTGLTPVLTVIGAGVGFRLGRPR